MKLTIRRPEEMTGKLVSLDVYINGRVCGQVAPSGQVELTVPDGSGEVFVKTSWCESNRVLVDSNTRFKAYAKGGLLGATFNSLFRPKSRYILERE